MKNNIFIEIFIYLPTLLVGSCSLVYLYKYVTAKIKGYSFEPDFSPFKNKAFSKNPIFYAIILLTVIIAPLTAITEEKKHIPDGTYCLNVSVQYDINTYYTLPAEVRLISDGEGYTDGYYDGTSFENLSEDREFILYKFYWPNGGYCVFSSDEPLSFHKHKMFTDYHGRDYGVMLLDEKAYHPEIFEYQEGTISRTTIYIFAAALSTLICLFLEKIRK